MKATRPGEFVCFCTVSVPTKEGEAHVFLFIDAFSAFAMLTGVEPNVNSETILKHVYLLTEHEDFKKNLTKGFTIVLNDYYDLALKIKSIIQPYGKILFDEKYHEKICEPAVSSLIGSMMKGSKNVK